MHPLAMIANGCSWIFVAKRFADVFGYKQRLSAFVGYDTDWLGFKLEWHAAIFFILWQRAMLVKQNIVARSQH